MMRTLGIFVLALAVGCGGMESPGGSTGTPGGGSGGPPAGGGTGQGLSGMITADLTISGDVTMSASATVTSGVTLTFQAGAILHATSATSLIVQGTLVASGTAASSVKFQSTAASGPGQWAGIVLASGGTANLTYVEIHNATLAVQVAGNSHFTTDHILIDSSSQMMSLGASAMVSHGTFHALGSAQSGSPIVINGASPHFTDVLVDNGYAGVDMVIVAGTGSSPQFDHVEIAGSHCAFHFSGGSNTIIKSSFIHGNAYAAMVENSTGTQFQNSNLESNSINLGACSGGSVAVTGCYLTGNVFDSTCSAQSTSGQASSPLTGVGPRL